MSLCCRRKLPGTHANCEKNDLLLKSVQSLVISTLSFLQQSQNEIQTAPCQQQFAQNNSNDYSRFVKDALNRKRQFILTPLETASKWQEENDKNQLPECHFVPRIKATPIFWNGQKGHLMCMFIHDGQPTLYPLHLPSANE